MADATLAKMSRASYESAYQPKVAGACCVLDVLCTGEELDFFVGFSSVASLLGLPAQANYAASNAQLDALMASWRCSRGLPAVTVQLGGVTDVGMSARVDDHVHAWGVGQIASADFGALLDRVIEAARSPTRTADGIVLIGANLDLRTLATTRSAEQKHVLSALVPDSRALPLCRNISPSPGDDPHTNLVTKTGQATNSSSSKQQHTLTDVLKVIIKSVEDVAGLADIPTDHSLYEAGLDSLSAIQLRNVLAERFPEVELEATLIFDHATIDSISQHIMQQLASMSTIPSADHPPTGIPADPKNVQVDTNTSSSASSEQPGIAIIGVEARMPGSAVSFKDFWNNLCAGVDGIKDVPYSRWDADDYFDPNPMAGGKACYVQRAGFVDNVEWFDNELFGITPMEARVMDPSQRMMLETAYRAFTAAGYDKTKLRDTDTGVFVGSLSPDWRQVLTEHTAYSGTGSALSIMANRISFILGLLGPSMTVDTACSSSLVAMDLACQHIRSGRCKMALVGGVQTILSNSPFINGCKARMLSPEAHCKTWDAGADGYVKAEGCGAIVLKDLAAAER